MEEEEEKTSMRLCLILSQLPEDLIINNILLKVPVRSVMRLRCVCKYFCSLTTTRSFVNLHLDHAKTNQLINNHPASTLISYLDRPVKFDYKTMCSSTLKQLILINTTTTNCRLTSSGEVDDNTNTVVVVEDVKNIPCDHRSSAGSLPFEQFQIWGSCNGLLCVVGAGSKLAEYPNCLPWIWNPCTKEFKRLPPPPLINLIRDPFLSGISNHGFGYDRTMDDYKVIIWIHWNSLVPGVPSESEINVYTLGATNSSWSSCASSSYNNKPAAFGGIQRLQGTGLYFKGALHWVVGVADHYHLNYRGPFRKQIVSFDIEAEAFRELVPSPPVVVVPCGCYLGEDPDYWVLEELRGCLCLLICTTQEERIIVDVWMMKDDYGLGLVNNGCWTNLLTIVAELPTPASNHPSLFRFKSIPLRLCENGEILILEDKKGLYMYDPNKKTTRSIIETRDIQIANFVCMETYTESLVSLKTVFPPGI